MTNFANDSEFTMAITSYNSHFQMFLIALFQYYLSFQIPNLDRFHILIAFQQDSVFWCENRHLKTIKAFQLFFHVEIPVCLNIEKRLSFFPD